jgi:hypothetical protein
MTSAKQNAANRRNASKSSGPRTEEGKHRSRRNAVRHGLTAETVIGTLEDAEDYKAFEAAITADYDAQSAVERELVLRLAGLLWRLRRATTIEAGLFEIQAAHPGDLTKLRPIAPVPRQIAHAVFGHPSVQPDPDTCISGPTANLPLDLTRSFLRLANLPNCALDRLSRYEAALWRQVRQTLITLDALDRCKPQERGGLFCRRARQRASVFSKSATCQ